MAVPESSPTLGVPRRPGVITFIGVILLIQGFLGAVAAVVVIAFRNSDTIQEATNQTAAALTGAGIGEAIVALLYILVGFGILGGSRGARLVVAIVQALGMGFAIYLLLTHHGGGYTTRSFVTILIALFVLWALYGNDESDEYFRTLG